MDAPRSGEGGEYKHLQEQSALPGKGGLLRIGRAFWNTMGGFREGLSTEAAVKQEEAALILVARPVSFFVADSLWVWVALMGSLVLLLAAEFLNRPSSACAITSIRPNTMPSRSPRILPRRACSA